MNTTIAFKSEVNELECECHTGQLEQTVYLVHPEFGKIPFAKCIHKNDEVWEKKNLVFVKIMAKKFLAAFGIDADKATDIKTVIGDEADKAVQDFVNNNREDLH